MGCEDVFHIGGTAVAEFDDIFVADFMQPVWWWEVLLQEVKEGFTNVSGNPVVIWRIEPHNFSSSLPNNLYELSMDSYKKLLKENVTASYQKTTTSTLNRINSEEYSIAHNLKLEDRIESFPPHDAFIMLKDHKENFCNHPKCRLINPAKSEIGKISKHHLDTINVSLCKQSGLNQWHNTASTLSWFNAISDKPNCKFLKFAIVEFYPSITKKLLTDAFNFANNYVNINDEAIDTIMHAHKSLLFLRWQFMGEKVGSQV